jgi:hypothetical protein
MRHEPFIAGDSLRVDQNPALSGLGENRDVI